MWVIVSDRFVCSRFSTWIADTQLCANILDAFVCLCIEYSYCSVDTLRAARFFDSSGFAHCFSADASYSHIFNCRQQRPKIQCKLSHKEWKRKRENCNASMLLNCMLQLLLFIFVNISQRKTVNFLRELLKLSQFNCEHPIECT